MSQPASAAPATRPFELVYSDGVPLETDWHTLQLPFLRELIRQAMAEQGRADFFVGVNTFVYYSVEQAREVANEVNGNLPERAFRGPDVFWVSGIDPDRDRKVWIAWEEDERLPDVIFEFLSPKTAKKDRTEKRDLYSQVFGTPEYYMYDPRTGEFEGLSLAGRSYRPMRPDPTARTTRFWSEQLGVYLGLWHGAVEGKTADWVRLYHPDGSLVPTRADAAEGRAEAEHRRAEAERQRAETLAAEVARLRAQFEGHSRG
ncbi:MAG: Uma2 family endonuclease [Acidobacteriota bacterium]|nr:Uma2 family endonuclease [Acidobacteriota bacterium]